MSRHAESSPRRPLFRDGDVLTHRLLAAEFAYHAGSRQRHLDAAHPQRARSGLELVLDGERVLLLEGRAVDGQGRVFSVPEMVPIPLATLAADLGESGWLELCLAGHPGAHGADGTLSLVWAPIDAQGRTQARRPDVSLVLGRLHRDGAGRWHLPAPRAPWSRHAGPRLELEAGSLTLRDQTGHTVTRIAPRDSVTSRSIRCPGLRLTGPLDLAPDPRGAADGGTPAFRLGFDEQASDQPSRLEVLVGGHLRLAVDAAGVHAPRLDRRRAAPWMPSP